MNRESFTHTIGRLMDSIGSLTCLSSHYTHHDLIQSAGPEGSEDEPARRRRRQGGSIQVGSLLVVTEEEAPPLGE